MRGEHAWCLAVHAAKCGSAPHMRGIRGCRYRPARTYGVSPARAGNTNSGSSSPTTRSDQPRVCGEYSRRAMRPLEARGSAPRVRGIRPLRRVDGQGEGISPACAGNTGAVRSPPVSFEDQPRVCGEYRVSGGEPADEQGISPACAGNTWTAGATYRCDRDQPRVCGNTTATGTMAGRSSDQPRVCGNTLHESAVFRRFRNAEFTCFLRFALHLSCRERRPSRPRPRHGMRHRSGGWMPAFRHASAMQRIVSVRSCAAGTLRNPRANASRTAFAVHPCSTARMAIP